MKRLLLLCAFSIAAPAAAIETRLDCQGSGTITSYGEKDTVSATTVSFALAITFDETAATLTAKVPRVDYLRRISDRNGLVKAMSVEFTPQLISARFRGADLGLTSIPRLEIDRLSGAFRWGPHSGRCSPVIATEKLF